jgi:hypothetical protein
VSLSYLALPLAALVLLRTPLHIRCSLLSLQHGAALAKATGMHPSSRLELLRFSFHRVLPSHGLLARQSSSPSRSFVLAVPAKRHLDTDRRSLLLPPSTAALARVYLSFVVSDVLCVSHFSGCACSVPSLCTCFSLESSPLLIDVFVPLNPIELPRLSFSLGY